MQAAKRKTRKGRVLKVNSKNWLEGFFNPRCGGAGLGQEENKL